jgi:low affinity Fe/Cu permease
MKELFRIFAAKMSEITGSVYAFTFACLLIIGWACAGPYYHWSDSHSLFINTLTTIITFLMVFLIQNTQNRDAKGTHLKLDELIKATQGARNTMIDLDKLSDDQLKRLENEYKHLCELDESSAGEGHKAITAELERRGSQGQHQH